MAERGIFRVTTGRDLMRDINYTFDENTSTLVLGGSGAEPSFGTPIEVLESKGRLLASIAGAYAFVVGAESSEWLEEENAQL